MGDITVCGDVDSRFGRSMRTPERMLLIVLELGLLEVAFTCVALASLTAS